MSRFVGFLPQENVQDRAVHVLWFLDNMTNCVFVLKREKKQRVVREHPFIAAITYVTTESNFEDVLHR